MGIDLSMLIYLSIFMTFIGTSYKSTLIIVLQIFNIYKIISARLYGYNLLIIYYYMISIFIKKMILMLQEKSYQQYINKNKKKFFLFLLSAGADAPGGTGAWQDRGCRPGVVCHHGAPREGGSGPENRAFSTV